MSSENDRQYDDILHLPHPTSQKHPRMPVAARAAQFAPFAALSGHGTAIRETARLTEEWVELTEERKAELNGRLQILERLLSQCPEVTVTWFRPDGQKEGGAYLTVTGQLKKIDRYARVLVMEEDGAIPLKDVVEIESPLFRYSV